MVKLVVRVLVLTPRPPPPTRSAHSWATSAGVRWTGQASSVVAAYQLPQEGAGHHTPPPTSGPVRAARAVMPHEWTLQRNGIRTEASGSAAEMLLLIQEAIA